MADVDAYAKITGTDLGDQLRDQLPATPRTDVPVGTEVRLRFPAPSRPVSVNAEGNMHWAQRATFRKTWRRAACAAALAAREDLASVSGCRLEVSIALPYVDRVPARIDNANTAATTKPCVDGITDAGVLWPDDNSTWVTLREPILYVGTDVVMRFRVVAAGSDFDPNG